MAIEHDVLILGRTVVSPEASGNRALLRLTNAGEGFEDFECNVTDIRYEALTMKQMLYKHTYCACVGSRIRPQTWNDQLKLCNKQMCIFTTHAF